MKKSLIKLSVLGLLAVAVSGCSASVNPSNEWFMSAIKPVGEKSYDPPGGDWIFLPNEPNSARGVYRRQGWNWNGDGSAPQY